MLKRILVSSLAVVLVCSMLTGCEAPALDASGSTTDYTATIPAEAEEDVIAYLTDGAVSSSDTVMTVNGVEIPASAYFYQFAYYADYMAYYYQSEDANDTFSLEQEFNGTTYGDYLTEAAKSSLIANVVMGQKGKEKKLTLSDDTQTSLNTLEESSDGNSLLYYATTTEGMKFLMTNAGYGDQLKEALFSKGGEYALTKATLKDYRESNVLGAKHILLMTTGKSDEEKAEVKETIQGYLDDILKSKDPAAAFDKYMKEKSEDTGLEGNPDGYTFLPGEMVSEFETAVKDLKVGEICPDVVETSYGYHLIMRIEPNMDAIDDETLTEHYTEETYQALMDTWTQEAKVEISDVLKDLDLNRFYDKYTRLQKIIQTIEQAKAADTAKDSSAAVSAE